MSINLIWSNPVRVCRTIIAFAYIMNIAMNIRMVQVLSNMVRKIFFHYLPYILRSPNPWPEYPSNYTRVSSFHKWEPTDCLRGGLLQSCFNDSLYNQAFFFPEKGGAGPLKNPLNPPLLAFIISVSCV